jgi:hypothetical protein
MNNSKHSDVLQKPARACLWLTVPISILLAIAAGGGVFIDGLYRDVHFFALEAVAQDFVSLAVVLPTLAISAALAARGSHRAQLIWLGGIVYVVYTYVIDAFVVRFNSMFLVYVALLGCSLYALIVGIATANVVSLKASFTERTPVRTVSAYLSALAALFYVLWLRETIPALLARTIPASVQQDGAATNPVHVLDMAWMLPAFFITASSLWRRRELGYLLAGAALSFIPLLALAVLSMVVFLRRAGYHVVDPQALVFAVVFALSLGLLVSYLKALQPSAT